MEYEADVGFAGLHQLVGQLGDHVEELPASRRSALEVAWGSRRARARPAVGLDAALATFRRAAVTAPLLVVVDDMHWLDEATASVVGPDSRVGGSGWAMSGDPPTSGLRGMWVGHRRRARRPPAGTTSSRPSSQTATPWSRRPTRCAACRPTRTTCARCWPASTAPSVLAGHSYGGSVMSEAADGNAAVKALVYVASFILEEGESTGELAAKFPGGELGPALRPVPVRGPDGQEAADLYIQQDRFREVFAADVPEEVTPSWRPPSVRSWATRWRRRRPQPPGGPSRRGTCVSASRPRRVRARRR